LDSKYEGSLDANMTSLKRARPSDGILLETTKVQKMCGGWGRPKVKDYDDMTQEVLVIAIAIYRCLICIDTPFPDHAKELEFVKIGWVHACKKLGVRLEMTTELVKMVFQVACRVH
jgi:hypothetical protein